MLLLYYRFYARNTSTCEITEHQYIGKKYFILINNSGVKLIFTLASPQRIFGHIQSLCIVFSAQVVHIQSSLFLAQASVPPAPALHMSGCPLPPLAWRREENRAFQIHENYSMLSEVWKSRFSGECGVRTTWNYRCNFRIVHRRF